MQPCVPIRPMIRCAAIALSWALLSATLGSLAAQAEERADQRATRTIFDTTPPEPGTLVAPATSQGGVIELQYSGASDDGSGLDRVTLWVREGETASWRETEWSEGGSSGSFSFSEALGDGVYYFAIVAQDRAGNRSPEPSGDGMAATVLDTTPPVITLNPAGASINMVVPVGASFNDPGATAVDDIDGDVSHRIVVSGTVDTSTPGTYTVVYSATDAAGNEAEERTRLVQVVPAANYVLTILSPESGSIQALPAPGAGGGYPADTVVTLAYRPPSGSDLGVAAWIGAEPDPNDPSIATVVMDQNRAVGVSLMVEGGTVEVSVTPPQATWVITDSSGGTYPGTGSTQLRNIPAGQVTIAYNDLSGYTTPPDESAQLAKASVVSFEAEYRASQAVILAVPSGLRARPGETVEVPITASSGEGLSQYSVRLEWDAAALAFDGLSAGSIVAAWGAPTASPASGAVTISGTGPARTGSSGGTLATVTLRALDSAPDDESALTIAGASLNNGAVPVQARNGSIRISAFDWVWGDVNGDGVANAVDANLILRYLVGLDDTLPIQDMEDDPEFIEPANVKGADPASVGMQDAYLVYRYAHGSLARFPADLNGDGVGPEPASATGEVRLPSEITSTRGEVRTLRTLGSIIVEPGAEVRVPVSIDSATGVFGYLFEMTYDASRLEFQSLTRGQVAEPWIQPVMRHTNGVVTWAASGADRLSGAGQLAVLTFRGRTNAAAGSVAALSLRVAELNDGLMTVQIDANPGAPTIDTVTPERVAVDGYSAITLEGANLATVDNVLIGDTPARYIAYDPRTGTLKVITPPHAAGTVSITASALGRRATLDSALTYFAPEVHIGLEPEQTAFVGEFFPVPVTLTSRAGTLSRISFVLNFESDTFARATVDPVVAAANGVQVTRVQSVGPGQLAITLEGALNSGQLCVVNLVVVAPSAYPDSLLFVSGGEAFAGGASKDVTGGSALFGGGGP